MRQIVATIMLLLCLACSASPGLDLHEIQHLQSLVRHFHTHFEATGASLMEFLADHYSANATPSDASNTAHAELPLKGHSCTPGMGLSVAVDHPTELPRPLETCMMVYGTFVSNRPLHLPGPLPFQPPRP